MSILGGLLYQPETSSTVLTEIITKTTTDVLMSSSNVASQTNISTNNIEITNVKSGTGCSLEINTDQKILQTPNFTSVSELDQNSELNTKLKDALEQSIKNTTRGIQLLTSPTNSEVINKHINDIATNVSNMSLVSCLQTNTASNDLYLDNIEASCPAPCNNPNMSFQYISLSDYDKLCTTSISNSQDIVQAAVASCISKNTQVTDSINELAKTLISSSEKETAGLDPEGVIGSIGKATSSVLQSGQIIFIVLGIIAIIFVFAYFYMTSGKLPDATAGPSSS